MARKKNRPSPPWDAADIIEKGMKEVELTNRRLAEMLETTPAVITAILARDVPVPLMWVTNIADAIECDPKSLMTQALGEQWLATLTAIAGSMLWEEGAVQRELIAFFTQLGDGECPSMSEDPTLAQRLAKAFRDPDAEDENEDGGDGGRPH